MMAGEGVAENGGRLDYRGKMILAPMVKVILLFKQSHTWVCSVVNFKWPMFNAIPSVFKTVRPSPFKLSNMLPLCHFNMPRQWS